MMTPVYKILLPKSRAIVWAKIENQNLTGTHKDRSMRPWILHYLNQGMREFAISSSGNSAISAARYCAEKNIKLHVFVRPDIARQKISRLRQNKNVLLNFSHTPRKNAIQFAKKNNIVNLRASFDDKALDGYGAIAFELKTQLPRIDAIFIPTSSGATAEGIYKGYKTKNTEFRSQIPAFYVVQTTKVHPIASYFDKNFEDEKTSYASAIVDNVAHRKDRIIKIVQETGGGGFVISNKELESARMNLCGRSDLPHVGWQSALSFAGFLKWQKQNPNRAASAVSLCLFTD